MKKVLIVGTGGVGRVVAYKCAQASEVFDEIHVANRTLAKAEKLSADIERDTGRKVHAYELNADHTSDVVSLLDGIRPDIAVNTALPYQNISIMKACLEARVNYLDTAISEELEPAEYDYKWQRAFHEQFKERGLTGLLGCGFDPGASNVYCAYARQNLFAPDAIKTIDILDCNAGNHGQTFMPNFNPETNLREFSTQNVKYWEKGKWIIMPSMEKKDALHFTFEYPENVGPQESYLLFHEEMMSLVENIKGLERMRFFMTFSDEYIKNYSVLKNNGLLGTKPVMFRGQLIVPVQFLSEAILPQSAKVADRYTGKTAIGCIFSGTDKEGKYACKYIYNICDHEESFKETGIHAIAYTTGVPAMVGAMLIANGTWKGAGVYHPEQFNPDPFMKEMGERGLPWKIVDFKGNLPQ